MDVHNAEFDDFDSEADDNLVEVPDDYVPIVADPPGGADSARNDDDDEPVGGGHKSWRDVRLEQGDEAYSKNVQTRLRKEKFARHEEERQRQAAEARAAQLEEQLAAIQAERDRARALSDLQELEQTRRQKARELRALQDDFAEDSEDKAIALDLELRELDAQVVHLKRQSEPSKAPAEPPPRQAAEPSSDPIRRLAEEWKAATPAFSQNPAFQAKAEAMAVTLEQEEGMNPAHPAFWAALTHRLTQTRPYSGPTSAPARGHEGAGAAQAAGGKFTASHAAAMRAAGKDPTNPSHRADFMRTLREFGGGIKRQ